MMKPTTCLAKRVIPLLMTSLLLQFPFKANAQIGGCVLDEDLKPLAYANVILIQSKDSAVVKGAATGEHGKFSISDYNPGSYLLLVSMLGYESQYATLPEIEHRNKQVGMQPLVLKESFNKLKEVKVTAVKPQYEMQVDRLVVNLENSVTTAGSSALETLEKSPGVVIDRQHNTISLMGKNGARLMINGKLSRMPKSALIQMLESMDAENISKIELITAPPAKYDAEGNAGIINIVLKKNDQTGTNGSMMLSAGMGVHEKLNGALDLNHHSKKANYFTYLNSSYRDNHNVITSTREMKVNGSSVSTTTESVHDPDIYFHNAKIGMDYFIGKNTSLGILFNGYYYKYVDSINNYISQYVQDHLITKSNLLMSGTSHWLYGLGNVYLEHQFKKSGKLNINIDLLSYKNENPAHYTLTNSDALRWDTDEIIARKNTPLNIAVIKTDYTKEFNPGLTLEAGMKGTRYRFSNDISVNYLRDDNWETDPWLTNKYVLNEQIMAAYASASFNIDEKTVLYGGTRFEFIHSDLGSASEPEMLHIEYGKFFPSFYFSHKLNKRNRLQISLNRRIDRPSFNELAPYIIFLSPGTYVTGNETLRPAFSNQYKFEYKYRLIFLTASYTSTRDLIAPNQPGFDEEQSIQYFTSLNYDQQHTYTAVLSFPGKISNWWTMQNSIQYNYQRLITGFEGENLDLSQHNYRLYTTQRFAIGKQLTGEVTAFFRSRKLSGIYTAAPLGRVDVGMQFKSLKQNCTLSLNVTDVFKTSVYRSSADFPELNLHTEWTLDWEPRRVKLTFRYTFGNHKLKNSRKRQTASEELQQRVQTE